MSAAPPPRPPSPPVYELEAPALVEDLLEEIELAAMDLLQRGPPTPSPMLPSTPPLSGDRERWPKKSS
jgi:hypothetical protein